MSAESSEYLQTFYLRTVVHVHIINSSRAEPKILLCSQCCHPQNRNRNKKSKIFHTSPNYKNYKNILLNMRFPPEVDN